MKQLLQALMRIPEAEALAAAVETGGCPAAVTGLGGVHRTQIAGAIAQRTGRPLVMVCSDEGEAGRLAGDLEILLGEGEAPCRVGRLFARELFVRAGTVISRQWEHNRIAALYELGGGGDQVLVATAEALLQKTSPPRLLREAAIPLEVGKRYDPAALALRLTEAGYSRADQVEGVGQFALRGGILDVFSPLMDEPVRCEFFDDEIDSLGSFDTATQRRTKNLTSALLLPASELPEGAEPAPVFAYLPGDALVCLNETARLGERVKNVLWQAREDTESLLAAGEANGDLTRLLLSQGEWLEGLEGFALCMLEALPTSRYPLPPRTLLSVTAKQLSAYGGSIESAAGDLEHYRDAEFAVLLLCGNPTRTSGTFFDAFHTDRTLYKQHTVSSMDSPRTNKENIDSLIRKYGKDSSVVLVRVFGEFPKQEDDVLIMLSLIEHCCMLDLEEETLPKRIAFGVDVARYGGDETVIAQNIGGNISLPVTFRGQSLMTTVGKAVQLYRKVIARYPMYRGNIFVNIDDCGLGGGVTDRLVEVKQEERLNRMVIVPVNAAGKVPEDVIGNEKIKACDVYDDMSTYLWGTVKEKLLLEELHLPNDNDLAAQLSCRKYRLTSRGKMRLESKEEMKKRGIPSPDRADAVALSCYEKKIFNIGSLAT